MPRIVTGEGALYYERQGVGFPVLFVTGLSGFASFWQEQVAAFSRKFDVVTHDHRGIGQSDPTRSGFTVDRMAADVIGLMDALEIERAHVVGHSTGGAIAQILAIEHPKRLASMVRKALTEAGIEADHFRNVSEASYGVCHADYAVLIIDREDSLTKLAQAIAQDSQNIECRRLGRQERPRQVHVEDLAPGVQLDFQ